MGFRVSVRARARVNSICKFSVRVGVRSRVRVKGWSEG